MPKKGRNIYKRKDGRWEARYIKSYDENGKIKYGYVYAKTYNEAKIKQDCLSRELKGGMKEDMINGTSFYAVSHRWLEIIKVSVKESTYAKYMRVVDKYLGPYFKNISMEYISNEMIERYIIYLMEGGRLDSGGGLSGKTTRDIIAVLKLIIKYARKNDIDINCIPDEIKIKRSVKNIRVLDKSEQKVLTEYLLKDVNLTKLGVMLSLYTGIRIGELCALQWGDINLEENFISITKTLQRIEDFSGDNKTKIIIDEPKSEASKRVIPVPGFLSKVLYGFAGKSDEFILTGDRIKFVEPRTMQERFRCLLEECGLEQVNFHALRHTFATRCVEIGFEIKSLSEILGHSNVNITLDKYVHSSLGLKRDNMEKLGTFI